MCIRDSFIPVVAYVLPTVPFREALAYLPRTAYFVEHVETSLVGMVKHGTVRIEGGDFLHDQELQVAQRCFAEIHDVHLHTLQQLAFAYTIERLQVRCV